MACRSVEQTGGIVWLDSWATLALYIAGSGGSVPWYGVESSVGLPTFGPARRRQLVIGFS